MDNQKLNVKPDYGYGFIYCYISPSNKRYIGQTKTSLKERAKKDAKGYMNCKAFYNAIKKYGFDNFSVEILAEVPYENLNETETQMILKYNTTDPDYGYNILTESIEIIATLNQIPIYSYDASSGVFIESYHSIADAERAMGVYNGSIRRVVNTNHRVKNRLWKSEKFDSVEPYKPYKQVTCKKVYMYDSKTGDFLNEFESIREASRVTKYDRASISKQVIGCRQRKIKAKHIFSSFKVDNLYQDGSSTTI